MSVLVQMADDAINAFVLMFTAVLVMRNSHGHEVRKTMVLLARHPT